MAWLPTGPGNLPSTTPPWFGPQLSTPAGHFLPRAAASSLRRPFIRVPVMPPAQPSPLGQALPVASQAGRPDL